MSLADFVRALPKNWATAPIYAKGATLPSGRIACGKVPLVIVRISPQADGYIMKSPDTFTAVGVYTGTRSNGLIFDVDYNRGDWGKGGRTSPPHRSNSKDNVSKFLFVVPEDDLKVASISHVAAGQEGGRFSGVLRAS